MEGFLSFETRDQFREWLKCNCTSVDGIWIRFSKTKDIVTLKANEALEEALCYGWIDGVMKRLDDKTYIKYFSARRKNSKWSEKNKAIAGEMEKRGLMTDFGRAKIEEAKKNGQWNNSDRPPAITEEQIAGIAELLKGNEQAYVNFRGMSPSVRKTYARAYFDAKTPAGRAKRLAWMMERIEKNLKPM